MLVQIDKRGLDLIEKKTEQEVKGQLRCYYVGAGDEVPTTVVVKDQALEVGQVWDASSGNEVGHAGFCRDVHEGKKVGKLTLHKLVDVDTNSISGDIQIFPLSYQIRYFVERFGDVRKFNQRWSV